MPLLTLLSDRDGSWDVLKADWRAQCDRYGEDFDAYAIGAFSVLNPLAATDEARAGIFGYERDGSIAALCQANVTPLPGYDGPVLRIRMIVLSPDFDFGENYSVEDYVGVLTGVFVGVLELSHTSMLADHVKFHLRSPADRSFFSAFGNELSRSSLGWLDSVKLSGSWLYVTKKKEA